MVTSIGGYGYNSQGGWTPPTTPVLPAGTVRAPGYIPPYSGAPISTLPGQPPPEDKPPTAHEEQAMVCGEDTVVPVIYGQRRRGSLLAGVWVSGGDLYMRHIWGIGECEALSELRVNETATVEIVSPGSLAAATRISAVNYLGTTDQVPDPDLVLIQPGYEDTLAGNSGRGWPAVCYTVLKVPASAEDTETGFPHLTALVSGLKVRQYQEGSPGGWTTSYSDNPAWCLADFLTNRAYGVGATIDWMEALSLALLADQLVASTDDGTTEIIGGGTTAGEATPERRRIFSLAIDTVRETNAWVEVLRDYAGAILSWEGEQIRIVPDKPYDPLTDVSVAFDTTNVLQNSVRIRKRGAKNLPTCVRVNYTNTTEIPWVDASMTVYANGVLDGALERRMQTVDLPGIFRYSEAKRVAVRRLNDAQLQDLTVDFQVRDEGLKLRAGMFASFMCPPFQPRYWTGNIKPPLGTAAVRMSQAVVEILRPNGEETPWVDDGEGEPFILPVSWRLLQAVQASPGRWNVSIQWYDKRAYDDSVYIRTGGVVPPIIGPGEGSGDPSWVPDVSRFTAVAEVFAPAPGVLATRLRLSWSPVVYANLAAYELVIQQSDGASPPELTTIVSVDVLGTEFTTGIVEPSALYIATLRVRSLTNLRSAGVVREVYVGALSAAPYDIAGTFNGQPRAGVDMIRVPLVRMVMFPRGLAGSHGVVETAPTGNVSFNIFCNWGSPPIGSMDFAAGETEATFTFPDSVVFLEGDVLCVEAPSPKDSTLADLGFCFKCVR